jgi:hypothetical protein
MTAQVSTKKKAATTSVKKAPMASKKSSAKPVKNTTTKATTTATTTAAAVSLTSITNVTSGRNTCKVTTTTEGCTVVFEFNLDPNSELAKKGDTYSKKEFHVSYLDNSVTEVGKKDSSEGAVKVIKSEAVVLSDEGSNAIGGQIQVAIKDLLFVFDVLKDKKQLPITSSGCSLPEKMPDGIYVMNVNWNWDTNSEKATKLYCITKFKVEVKDGNYVGVYY